MGTQSGDGRASGRRGRRGAHRGTQRASHRGHRRAARRRRTPLTLTAVGLLLAAVCTTLVTAWAWRDTAPQPQAVAQPRTAPSAVPHGGSGDETSGEEASAAPVAAPEARSVHRGSAPGAARKPEDTRTKGPASAPAASAASGPLPFDLPDRAALRAKGKLVFAHYFTPYPLSLDNEDPRGDYYARNYLNPDGERGKHSEYGGLLRDRPLPVEPKEGDWELANLRQEVRTARDAGLDGFTLDILSLSGPNWERSEKLLEAARSVDSRFTVMLMPDMSSLRSVDAATLADALADLAESPAAHRLEDGRLVVSPFKAEAKSVGWWSDVLDRLRSRHGISTAFVPLFIDFGSQGEAFAPISHGFSDWGSRSYTGQDGPSGDARRAHALGKIWMQPVSVQDARPNQGVYDEAGNTAALRATWERAIDSDADWVQLTTWNDYSEGTHFAPSVNNGHTYLDLTSYYLTRFKTGSWPKIVRDTLYLTSRTQFAGADPTGDQSKVMTLRESSAKARDQVEVLAFLTAPATVRTTAGSTTTARDLKPGVHPVLSPLRVGAVSADALRDGRRIASVELRKPVRGSVEVQDLQYHAATSGR